MTRRPSTATARRARSPERLSRARIVDTAVAVADRDGLDALSMRKLGQRLGVDPMSLYHHLRDKDELLAAMADQVVATIAVVSDGPWSDALRTTIHSARRTMLRHPWSARVIQGLGTPTPAALQYLDAVLGILRAAGFSVALCHHAVHALGSRILGFSQDLWDDSAEVRVPPEVAAAQAEAWAATLPRLAELATAATHEGGLGGCDDDEEFAFALDLVIEGLGRRRDAESG